MEEMSENELRIWKYLDGELSESESTNLRHELKVDPELMKFYEECRKMHVGMQQVKLQSPSNSFTGKVMESINSAGTSYHKGGLLIVLLAISK